MPCPRYGGWLNDDLADDVVAANADIVDPPDDAFDAVYGATGRRRRAVPF